MSGDNYELIDANDFPTLGRIEVFIQGGDSAEDIYSKLGSLVNIRINDEPTQNTSANSKNFYSIRYNPNFGKAYSNIWIESFSGKGFYQIIDINSNMEMLQRERSIPEPDFAIRTTLILLRYENKLYGPFEWGDIKEGRIPLNGVRDCQYSVGEYNAINYNDELLVIEDQDGEEAIILIPKSLIPSPQECDIQHDWIGEETLIDNFLDLLRAENSYTRVQVRQLKEMVHRLTESESGVQFTDDRILKLQTLFESIVQKEEYVRSVVQYALEDESAKKVLAEEVANNYFDRISEVSLVQDQINELKRQEAALKQSVEELQRNSESIKEESSEKDMIRIRN